MRPRPGLATSGPIVVEHDARDQSGPEHRQSQREEPAHGRAHDHGAADTGRRQEVGDIADIDVRVVVPPIPVIGGGGRGRDSPGRSRGRSPERRFRQGRENPRYCA